MAGVCLHAGSCSTWRGWYHAIVSCLRLCREIRDLWSLAIEERDKLDEDTKTGVW